MFKGLKFFIALLLMSTTSATFATHINHDRTGQVVLLPYYTVNTNFITNFTVTNTSGKFKAVRVRLLESRIGADLLNLNLYLSPYDVWNATLRMNPQTGQPNLITENESCTYPSKATLQAGVDLENPYSAITDADLREGYLEIIEMGDIADGAGPALDGELYAEIDASGRADGIIDLGAGDRSIVSGILHDDTGMPADCTVVTDAWDEGAMSATAVNGFEPGSLGTDGVAQDSGDPGLPYDQSDNAGLVAPSGGISAYGILINVVTGAAFVQEGVHIERYTTVAQHYLPDDQVHYRLPSLASGDVREAYITNAQGDNRKGVTLPLTEYDTGALHNIPPLPSVPMGSNPLPIALVLSADAVSAPYFVEPGMNGTTDIVLTFPMRKHGIYNGATLTNDEDGTGGLSACTGTLNDGIDDGEMITLEAIEAQVNDYPHDGSGVPCTNAGFASNAIPDVDISFFYYDYEEGTASVTPSECYIPCPIDPLDYILLQRKVNVINANHAGGGNRSVLGTPAENVFNWDLDAGFEAGWLTISTHAQYDYETNPSIAAMTEVSGGIGAAPGTWTGVPIIGFSVMAADIGHAQLGETVELIRNVNRN
ncbi:MAG: hypothetical protein AB2551_17475 [Candidatus Thiodiazotropha sp.]